MKRTLITLTLTVAALLTQSANAQPNVRYNR